MKPVRIVFAVLIIVFAAAIASRLLPGCRQQAGDVYRKYGGWTEKARKEDPVGFIEYAQAKLEGHLDTLKQARKSMIEARTGIEVEADKQRALLGSAGELANTFRASYQKAEGDAAYPVEIAGSSYSREDMLEQVRLILLQRQNYNQVIGELANASSAAKIKEQELITQITNTEASLAALPAKKEIARVNQLTGRMETLLSQIDELISNNEQLLGESPVRTVEELIASGTASAPAETEVDVMAFLERGE